MADDLDTIQRARANIISNPADMDSLLKYHAALCAMESRFPIGEGDDEIEIEFAWFDAFRDTRRSENISLPFEKAAVLFNIGAAQSQHALSLDRKSEQGRKDSKRAFEEAAGVFVHLRDTLSMKLESPRPVDLTAECCTLLEALFLGQAQECVYEHSVATSRSPAVLARLAAAAGSYYKKCAETLSVQPLMVHFDRAWSSHCNVKSLLCQVEATMQSSLDLRTSDLEKGVAREIARLRAARVLIEKAKKEGKAASKELQENILQKEKALNEQLAQAEKENNTVYLQRVPGEADLPDIEAFVAVKAVSPVEMLRPGSQALALFGSVIPEGSTKALSRYTAMADSLVREQYEKLAHASDHARLKFREWELPEALHALESMSGVRAISSLPDAARADIDSIQSMGGLSHLKELSLQIAELRRSCAEELDLAEQQLDNESAEDDQLRKHYGHRWRPASSAQLNRAMRDKVAGYRRNLTDAFKSDAENEQKLDEQASGLATLDLDAAAAEMPALRPPLLSTDDDMGPATSVATLWRAIEGQDVLSAQRAALEESLRDKRAKDDILPRLLAAQDSETENLYSKELQKYSALVAEVETNVSKQMKLLEVTQVHQQIFKNAYGYDDWKKQCTEAAKGIRARAASFRSLNDAFGEGLKFYISMQDHIAALRRQVSDFSMTRRLDRDQTVDDLRRQAEAADRMQQQMAAMHVQPQQPPPQGSYTHQGTPQPAPGSYYQPQHQPYGGSYVQPQQPSYQQAGGGYGAHPPPPPPSQPGYPYQPAPPGSGAPPHSQPQQQSSMQNPFLQNFFWGGK